MADAVVGDDVYGEDPTVLRLEDAVAGLLGKERGLFMPSGTMSNQVALLTHTGRADEIFLHRDSHIYYYEGGSASFLGSVVMTQLGGNEGVPVTRDLQAAIRPKDIHHPRPRLLVLENTHNRAGGAASGPSQLDPVIDFAHAQGLSVHMDGARLFNAAVALEVSPAELVHKVSSVSVCLSKGLGAPVGSLLVGTRDFIEEARYYRKWLGGGMRQAGVLAAAGLVSLNNITRLTEDHERARHLFQGLVEQGYQAWMPSRPTNMVMVELDEPAGPLLIRLKEQGVLAGAIGDRRIRLVTHLDIDDEGISSALKAFGQVGSMRNEPR